MGPIRREKPNFHALAVSHSVFLVDITSDPGVAMTSEREAICPMGWPGRYPILGGRDR
jgi:hypothetical protein